MAYKINEIADINISSLSSKEKVDIIHYLDTGNITKGFIEDIAVLELGVDKIPSRAKRKVRTGDIIYSTVRPNQEHYGYIEKENENLIVSTGFAVISPKVDRVNPYFLYCYLTLNEVTNYLQGIAENSTTAYPSIKHQDIGNLEIELPSRDIQDFIAKFIKDISQKMLLNNQMSNNLEELTSSLFKKWFIDFEFPNEQGLPYRSSGGEMVESELGEIPKGWEVEKLNYLAEIIMGQSPKGTSYNFEFEGLPLVNGASDFKGGEINPSKYTTEPKKISQKGDYIFGVRATLGNVTETHGEYAIGRGAGIARSKEPHFKEFLYFQLINAFDSFEHTASGSVYLNISKNDLNDYKIILPTNVLIQKFHETTSAILEKKEDLIQENIRLKSLRETLLPKLLSGEIEIPDESVVERS